MRLACSALALLFAVQAQAATTLSLVTVVAPDNPLSETFHQFIDTIFKRSNIPYTLTYQPTKRAGVEFKQGKFDGDVARTDFFAQFYPTAIRVEPAFISQPIYAISRDRNINNWKALAGLNIAYMRGNLQIESKLGPVARLNPVDQIDACIKMVRASRVDACILHAGTRPTAEFTFAKPALRIDQFDVINTYIWLAPQYQAQAAILGKTLLAMKQDGSLAAFQAILLNPTQPRSH